MIPWQRLGWTADGQGLLLLRKGREATVYGLDDRYRGVYNGRRVVFINRDDMKEHGFTAGQLVDLTSHFRGEERQAPRFLVTPYDIPRGAVATYFPEANVLVPVDSVAERSNTPTSKFVIVTLKPTADVVGAAQAIVRDARETAKARETKLRILICCENAPA